MHPTTTPAADDPAVEAEVAPDPVTDAVVVRSLQRLVAAVLVVLLAAGIAGAVALRKGGEGSRTVDGQIPATGGVGPLAGSLLDTYIARRQAALAGVTGRRAAVASFNGYLSVDAARALVGSLRVDAFLVALPGDEPLRMEPEEIQLRLRDLGAEAQSDLPDYENGAATAGDPAFVADYESRVAELRARIGLANVASPVVFAVVLRADATQLQALGAQRDLRLVDVADDDVVPAVARGIRPEEATEAAAPKTRPLPSP